LRQTQITTRFFKATTLKISERLDKAIAPGLLAAIVWTALAHGAVEAWSVAIFELIVCVVMLLWVLKSVADRRINLRIPSICAPVAALLILGLIQGISRTDESGMRSGISMDIEATRSAVIVLFFIFVSFVIAANAFTSEERLRSLANFLIIYGLCMAVFGLIQHFAWDGRFFWMRPTTRQAVFGPFANRNHFAGYMEMLLPLPLALVVAGYGRSELRLLYAFAAAMMGIAGFASLSRAGMISLASGLMFILFFSGRLQRSDSSQTSGNHSRPIGRARVFLSQGLAVLTIAAAITTGILWIGAAPVVDRVAETVDGETHSEQLSAHINRTAIWSDTWRMFRASPVLGVGLGAYQTAYPAFSRSDGAVIVAQAHNDYLQVLADGGIAGGAIALVFIFLIFRAVLRGVRSRDRLVRGLAAGSGAGIFAILVHSIFDFNLQLPSNALLFLLLAAVASTTSALASEVRSTRIARSARAVHIAETQEVV
jgi:O-antigen ligase